MRITLAELELHRVTICETFAPGALDFHGVEFRQTAPLTLAATAELVGPEIRIRGHLATRLEANCDRCLQPVELPVTSDFVDLFYRPVESIAREENEVEIPTAELEVGFYSGDGIESAEVAMEQVILAMPMKVVCDAECKGLCPICRANRNVTQCHCAPSEQDSPFSSLKGG